MSRETMEVVGEVADSIENLLAAMKLPLSPTMHLDALRQSLPKLAADLRKVYIVETGDDPWGGKP